jgi:hypothetical protein
MEANMPANPIPPSLPLRTVLLATALIAFAGPVQAIDAVTAIDMCGKNPNCKASINSADGWIDIFVGDDQVMCNPRGDQQCTCITCAKAAKGKGTTPSVATKTAPVGIPGIIAGSKTPAVGIPKPAKPAVAGKSPIQSPVRGFPKPVRETNAGRPPVQGFPRATAKPAGPVQAAPKQAGWKEPSRATSGQGERRR